MTKQEFIQQLNEWGSEHEPFFFMVDFEFQKPLAYKLAELPSTIQFSFNEPSHATAVAKNSLRPFKLQPVAGSEYSAKFKKVVDALAYGDTFLANLTVKTKVETSHTLQEIYASATARYKLLFNDEFVVYSPETFIKIENDRIYSFPMKGTIDASLPNAEKTIKEDEKELAEHVTIVDLIRNDLSLVATHVHVPRFRYVERIETNYKTLLQVSSEVVGELPPNWHSSIGNMVVALLPAGSISGAPKARTVEVIRDAEGEERGYYTGVVGYFDGERLDSAVMIRYLEQVNGTFYYRSGGGITTQSDCNKEYEETMAKIYVPLV
jgi:para-aminobenzoate synthetase component I